MRRPSFALVELFIVVLLSASTVHAQGVVRGAVLDHLTGAPVAAAAVTLVEHARTVRTDDAGRFVLAGVPAGGVTLRVTLIGYRRLEQRIVVDGAADVRLTIRLTPLPQQLSPVRTRAAAPERLAFETSPDANAVRIGGATVAAVPALGEADVLRTVQLLPGVATRSDFSAGYSVLGGESDQNLVLLDGIPVYNPFHLGGMFGTFMDEMVRDVSLQAGGFPAQYGGRLSSVLEVTSEEEARRGVHGSGELSVLASTLALGGGFADGAGSWNVGARRSYADLLARPLTGEDVPYAFGDAQLHALRQFADGSTLSLTGYAGRDVVDGRFPQFGDSLEVRSDDYRFDWGNQLLGAQYRRPLGPGSEIPLGGGRRIPLGDSAELVQRASVTRFATALDLGAGSRVLRNVVAERRLSGSLTTHQGRQARTFGYEYSQHHVTYGDRSLQLDAATWELDQRMSALSLFFDDVWRVSDRLILRPGLRLEHVGGTSWYGASPRASAKYFLRPELALVAAAGRYAQWMHSLRSEDTPIRIFDYWIASDRFVDVTTAVQGMGGVERWLKPTRFLRLEGYYKRYTDLHERNPADDPQRRGDEFLPVGGSSYGADLLVRQLESERVSGWVAYSYGVASREHDGRRYWAAQDRRHSLNVVASLRTARRYVLGARFGFATGSPFTDVEGELIQRVYDGTEWRTSPTRVLQPVGGARNAARYPAFHRLDLSASRSFRWGRAMLTPSIAVTNVYNHRNVFLYTFDFTGNPPTRETTSQLPILPTASLRVTF